MEILLLGTGSADGWPNPFCRCDSCQAATSAGVIRGQTAALVDDALLLDCGPEAPRAATRYGRSLAGVRYILFTHGHFDHVGPMALLMRQWASPTDPLEVVGPPSALQQCRDWVGSDDPVRFIAVQPGATVQLGDYRVRVLRAAHGSDMAGDAVLYDLQSSDGRILWATDTGPLPADTHAALAGAAFDAVFLEETFGTRTDHGTEHHDLPTFAATLAALRSSRAVTEDTDVIAVHLSHHNPLEPELAAALADSGALPGRDGGVVRVGASRRTPTRTLVLGGVRSGKSAHAEQLLAAEPTVTYLATGGAREGDPEWAERVRLHRARRPATWRTLETVDVADALRTAESPLLLDCLGTWLTARIDLRRGWDGDLAAVHADMDELVAAWRACPAPVVAVSNEVGSGVVPPAASGRLFRDLLGVLNARIAAEADQVVLMVAGRPLRLPAT